MRSWGYVKRAVVFVMLAAFSSAAWAEETYDPMNTMLALNMAIVSVRNMTASKDRAVLEQEYDRIINNLRLGDIESDSELVKLYGKLLDTISTYRLTEEEARVFSGLYDNQQKNAMTSALADLWPVGGDLESFFASLFTSGVTAYFGYREEREEIWRTSQEKKWELQKEALEALNSLQKELLADSWALLRKYKLADNCRITQEDLDFLEQALDQPDKEKACQMFSALEGAFAAYPPFWFYRAQAASRCDDAAATLEYLNVFDRLERPVLRRDPYKAEAARLRILMDQSLTRDEIAAQLAVLRENISPRDWVEWLFYGTVCWSIGDRDRGMEAVRNNVLFETESQLSSVVLEAMQGDRFDVGNFRTGFWRVMAGVTADSPTLDLLVAWFQEDDAEALRMAEEQMGAERWGAAPYLVASQVLKYSTQVSRSRRRATELQATHDQMTDKDRTAYADVQNFCRVYASQGRARAQFLMGSLYQSGTGVTRDPFKAAEWLHASALQGYAAAQTAYAELCLNGQGVRQDAGEAAKWFSRAASQNDPEGQYRLGCMYRLGNGVTKELARAAECFLAAARAGYAPAQADLGELYRKGAGVPKDYEESYKWSLLAKMNGDKTAQSNLNILDGKGALRGTLIDSASRERAKIAAQRLYEDQK